MNRWLLYDPEGGDVWFATKAEALKAAEAIIDLCRGERWDEGVGALKILEVQLTAQQVDILRPALPLNADGEDTAGVYWGVGNEGDWRCNYAMRPVEESP